MSDEATPRPWSKSEDGDGFLHIFRDTERGHEWVCRLPPGDDANADLIVTAVNAHDECIRLLTDWLATYDYAESNRRYDEDFLEFFDEKIGEDTIDGTRALVAKAKGQTDA